MTTIANLLRKNRTFSPTYHTKVLANHLSMALIALEKLGASDYQLNNFYEYYSYKLEPLPSLSTKIKITDLNWLNFLGCNEYFSNYLDFFKESCKSIGIDNTLRKYLQVLVTGISGQAFHCLIRLAYAIEIQEADEIEISLAYFACHYLSLGHKQHNSPILQHPNEVFHKINSTPTLSAKKIEGINITERFKKAATIPEFNPIIDWLNVGNTTLQEAASILINLYADTKDFTALHMVTATHAMRLIQSYFNDLEDALRYFWQAICAAYITIGSPTISQKSLLLDKFKLEQLNWSTIFKETTDSTDDHVIKLVYTCHEEYKIYKNPSYFSVAASAVNL